MSHERLGCRLYARARDGLFAGEELTALIKQYSDTSYFLDRLLHSLVQKRQEGTWDNNYWVEEESAEYIVNPEPSVPWDAESEPPGA